MTTSLALDAHNIIYAGNRNFAFFLCIHVLPHVPAGAMDVTSSTRSRSSLAGRCRTRDLKRCRSYGEIWILEGTSGMLRGCMGTRGQDRMEPRCEHLPAAPGKGFPRSHVKVGWWVPTQELLPWWQSYTPGRSSAIVVFLSTFKTAFRAASLR